MDTVKRELVNKVMMLVLQDAESCRFDAGMGGRWDDGGASRLEDQVKFYRLGLEGELPPEWEKYVLKNLDPEYQDYLRLQKKFGKL